MTGWVSLVICYSPNSKGMLVGRLVTIVLVIGGREVEEWLAEVDWNTGEMLEGKLGK